MRFARESVGASAASLFLLDEQKHVLSGLVSEWDWTRSSFPSVVDGWPTVARALADGESRTISADDAEGGEAEWFDDRGVTRTVCVPLRSATMTVGVLFFDFDAADAPLGRSESALLDDVAKRSVRAFAREAGAPVETTWLQ